MQVKVVVLAGDGIGPEVTDEAKKILDVVGHKFGHTFVYDHQLMGGCAIDAKGTSLPDETVAAALQPTPCCSARSAARSGTSPPRLTARNAGCWRIRKALNLFRQPAPGQAAEGS
jgi:3-isopropylmalate dehydrogenase